MSKSKTIKNLSKSKGRVYVFLRTEELGRQFFIQAEKEGFTFGDGVKPTEREYSDVMAVNPDMTINYVGTYGRMACGCKHSKVGGKKLIKIDYEKYISE